MLLSSGPTARLRTSRSFTASQIRRRARPPRQFFSQNLIVGRKDAHDWRNVGVIRWRCDSFHNGCDAPARSVVRVGDLRRRA